MQSEIASSNRELGLAAEAGAREDIRPPSGLLKTGFHTLGSYTLCAVASVLAAWLVARLAGPATKGAYDLYLATSAMINMLVGFSLPSGLVYVAARKSSNLPKLVPLLFGVAAIQGLITWGTLLALRGSRLATIVLPPGAGVRLIVGLALTVALGASITFLRALLIGCHLFIRANIGDLTKQGIGLAAATVALMIGLKSHHVVAALICANIVTLTLAATTYLKALPFKEQMHAKTSGLKEALTYSRPCYVANLAQFMNYKLDVFFVNAMVGTAALGIYQLSVTLTQSLALVPLAAATILLPLVAAQHQRPKENALRSAQVARLITFISTVSALVLGFASYWIVPKAFGSAFSASVVPLLLLLPGAVCLSLAAVLASHLAGMGFPELNLRASLAGLFVTIPLDVLLIPRHGINGAAVASTCAYFLSTVLNVWYFHRKTTIPIRDIVVISPEEIRSMVGSCRKLLSTKKPIQRVSAC